MDAITARNNLDAELRRLGALGRTGSLEPIAHGDAADDGAALYEREVERALDDEVLAEIQELAAAVARLDAGSYGRCEACHGPIPDERLAAVPATRFCVAHEQEAETHLGARPTGDAHDAADAVRREAQRLLSTLDEGREEDEDLTLGAEDDAVQVRGG